MSEYASPSSADLDAIEKFVIENEDLLALEEAIGRFNIFDALRIERTEIRHSNFLGWLLSPGESHGQGDLFLKAVLMDLLKKAREAGQSPPLSPVLLDGMELHDVEVRREWRNIDLLIVSHDPPFVVAIENEIDSSEHGDQLNRYESIVRTEYPETPALFVYLAIQGQDTEDEDWIDYSYEDVHRVLFRVKRTAEGSLGGDVRVFLDHYLSLIGSRFMNDTKIEELCRRIYSNHRRAIDLIQQFAPAASTAAVQEMIDQLEASRDRWIFRSRGAKQFQVVPRDWIGVLVSNDGKRLPHVTCELYVEMESWENAAYARLVVGPGDSPAGREQLIRALMEPPHQLRLKGKTIREKWTRLGSTRLVKWTEDDDVPHDAITQALHQWLSRIMPTLESLKTLAIRK